MISQSRSSRNIELDPLSFHVAGRRGYIAVCHKSIFGDMVQEWYTIPQLKRVLKKCAGCTDYWISQGEFATKSRCTRDLLRIQCCYIDLDYYKTEYRNFTPEQIAKQIELVCDKLSIPNPTVVVSSGNGVQVKWVFTYPIPAQALPRWKAVQSMLLKHFQELGADPAAADASRILRIVGTRNGKTLPGRDSLVRVVSEGPQWNFEALCNLLLPVSREKAKEARSRAFSKQKSKRTDGCPNLVRFDAQTLSWDRVNDLRRLADLRRNARGEVPEGCRELLVFWTLNHLCLSGVVAAHNFEKEAKALAHEISPTWAASFRMGSLETIFRKIEAGLAKYRGQGKTGLYTPRNATLIASLKITPSEEKQMKTIVSTAAAKERERIRSEKRRRAAGVRPRQVYLAESLTAQQPWKEEGISRATWYRRRKQEREGTKREPLTAQQPWKKEGISRATWYRRRRMNTAFIKDEIKTDTSRTVYLYGEAQRGVVSCGQPQPVSCGQPQATRAMVVPRTQPKWISDWERSFEDWIRALCDES